MGASQGRPQTSRQLTSIEICAGAGGQAVGLHNAGFDHHALVELDPHAVATLGQNIRSHKWWGWDSKWKTGPERMDVKDFRASDLLKSLDLRPGKLDLLAGGVPCPPFSLAGKKLGENDERDLFPEMLRIVEKLRPRAVMIENVRGILDPPEVFIDYRRRILGKLKKLGYVVPDIDEHWSARHQNDAMRTSWRRLDARNFGVPQLRPRAILVAIHESEAGAASFAWPRRISGGQKTVADALKESMRERLEEFWNKKNKLSDGRIRTGEEIYNDWLDKASADVAPTLVGGSKKHGGADLGPTRAKAAWSALGVDANGVANDPDECVPERDLFRAAGPMLTVEQAAILQGFPRDWRFSGGKTAKYRQVGNAFPPPVAEAVGRAIAAVLCPDNREELLKPYVMDTGEAEPGDQSEPYQSELDFSVTTIRPAPRKNRSRDLVSADA
ncbi:DNA (cytosine-5-)-methyltransferase [Kitasatospora sp. NPDC093806]|uniref:DNA cytosine methyltransferase n=1 Tax=Kitasatospora sp. NPDC093806 TaxID=3155075 RepID=UPI003441C4F6